MKTCCFVKESKRQLTVAALTCCMRAWVGEVRATVVQPWIWPCRAAALICCCRSNACLCWYICSWAGFSLLLAITAHQPVLAYSTDSLPKPADYRISFLTHTRKFRLLNPKTIEMMKKYLLSNRKFICKHKALTNL